MMRQRFRLMSGTEQKVPSDFDVYPQVIFSRRGPQVSGLCVSVSFCWWVPRGVIYEEQRVESQRSGVHHLLHSAFHTISPIHAVAVSDAYSNVCDF